MKSCIFQEDDTGVSDAPEGVVASRGPKPSMCVQALAEGLLWARCALPGAMDTGTEHHMRDWEPFNPLASASPAVGSQV